MTRLPILARRDFYDLPRAFVVPYRGEHFFFECSFDPDRDDYSDEYRVYRMPLLSDEELAGSWENLSALATGFVGNVAANAIKFDNTRRRWIESELLESLLTQQQVR